MYLKVRRKECVCRRLTFTCVCTCVEADIGSIFDYVHLIDGDRVSQAVWPDSSSGPASNFRLLGLEASHHSHLALTCVLGSRTLALEFIEQMIFLPSPSSQPNKRDF